MRLPASARDPGGCPTRVSAPMVRYMSDGTGRLARCIWVRAELRLIIITNDKEVVLRCGKEPDEPQLSGVHVLELVDAQVCEARLPAAAKLRIGLEGRHRTHHQVVEVDEAMSLHEGGERSHRARRGRRRPAAFDLPGRDH